MDKINETILNKYKQLMILKTIENSIIHSLFYTFKLMFREIERRKNYCKYQLIDDKHDMWYILSIDRLGTPQLRVSLNGKVLDFKSDIAIFKTTDTNDTIEKMCTFLCENYVDENKPDINTINEIELPIFTASTGYLKKIIAIEEVGILHKYNIQFEDGYVQGVIVEEKPENINIGDFVHLDDNKQITFVNARHVN